jgi:hypothetical protein
VRLCHVGMIVETSILLQGSEADVIAYCDALFAVSLFLSALLFALFIFHSIVLLPSTPLAPVNLWEPPKLWEAFSSVWERLRASGKRPGTSRHLQKPPGSFQELTWRMAVFGKWQAKNGMHSNTVV